eukprot:6658350-Pyramimonas_sp.AAC.1
MGSAGQPAESDFESGTGADASSDDEATALDNSDMPTCLPGEQQAQWLFLGCQKHKTQVEAIYEETSSQGTARRPTGAQGRRKGSRWGCMYASAIAWQRHASTPSIPYRAAIF